MCHNIITNHFSFFYKKRLEKAINYDILSKDSRHYFVTSGYKAEAPAL